VPYSTLCGASVTRGATHSGWRKWSWILIALFILNGNTIAKLLDFLATDYQKTVIMVNHDPKAVELFPKVYSMRDGRLCKRALSVPVYMTNLKQGRRDQS